MRVIPVIDLKGGRAVHAVRGERKFYQPLRSVLVDGSDPLRVARALRTKLGLDELYVADLDAIERRTGVAPAIGSLARESQVIVDAGSADVASARALLDLAVAGVVVGSETLPDAQAPARIRTGLPGVRLIVSLDLRGSRVVTRADDLRDLPPADALARLMGRSLHEAIVLDFDRVGTGEGPDIALVAELHRRLPDLQLLAGGGVRRLGDLKALRRAGAAGALVGTALHTGAIDRDALAALREGA